MDWGFEDFLAAAALLGGAFVALLLVVEFVSIRRWRYILGGVVLLFVLAIWAHLAVGII